MSSVAFSVAHLSVELPATGARPATVDDVSFEIGRGETLALVGESGCGKTMTALAIMRLLPPGAAVSGSIRVGGVETMKLGRRALEDLRGARIGMIFQEPMSALNPLLTVSRQMTEGLLRHRGVTRGEAIDRSLAALGSLGIEEPNRIMGRYPHQLSGGMRQRVVIAAALVLEPDLLIADEPTTALDGLARERVLTALGEIAHRRGTGILLITHDIGLAEQAADRVAVMKSGRLVEEGATGTVLAAPRHAYARALLSSRLTLERAMRERGWLEDFDSATAGDRS
jgi:ABC-type dipeptide/oligopeptide/nickel transport system ATPase component